MRANLLDASAGMIFISLQQRAGCEESRSAAATSNSELAWSTGPGVEKGLSEVLLLLQQETACHATSGA